MNPIVLSATTDMLKLYPRFEWLIEDGIESMKVRYKDGLLDFSTSLSQPTTPLGFIRMTCRFWDTETSIRWTVTEAISHAVFTHDAITRDGLIRHFLEPMAQKLAITYFKRW